MWRALALVLVSSVLSSCVIGGLLGDADAPLSSHTKENILKVVDTLNDLLTSLDDEEKEEVTIFTNMQDWCKKDVALYTSSVDGAEQQIENFRNEIVHLAAEEVRLSMQLADAEKDTAEAKVRNYKTS
jgi:hypothetical protein